MHHVLSAEAGAVGGWSGRGQRRRIANQKSETALHMFKRKVVDAWRKSAGAGHANKEAAPALEK